MIPEQSEQWRAAINPLDYLDFHALSEEGLRESEIRLENWGVEAWAILFRTLLITLGWKRKDKGTWVPRFALRSETALIGLQIRYPAQIDTESVYQYIFVRFVAEALRPFVEYASKTDRRRRKGYESVVKLYRLCERYETRGKALKWPKHLEPFYKRMPIPGWRLQAGKPETREVYWARHMSQNWFKAITNTLNPDTPRYWDMSSGWLTATLTHLLDMQYKWIFEGQLDNEPHYTDLIATAYLKALESECPPPNWLPDIS
ncbi:MAG: hypothetical protein QM758_05100 [Armatimonas sp.]